MLRDRISTTIPGYRVRLGARLEYQIGLSGHLRFLTKEEARKVNDLCVVTAKLLYRLIQAIRKRQRAFQRGA